MKTLMLCLAILAASFFPPGVDAQLRVEDTGDGAALCADGISTPFTDSPTLCAKFTTLTDQQMNELRDIRARTDQLGMEHDAMVAYIARDVLMALVLSAPKIDLRSWSITPIGFDRVIVNGSLYMAHSGAPGSMRSYTFTLTPEAGGP